MRTPAVLLPLLTLLTACTPEAPVQYRVPDLRILAINAVTATGAADADPGDGSGVTGDTVAFSALVANPRNRLGVTVTWYACAPPLEGSPCDPRQLRDLESLGSELGVFPLGSGENLSFDLRTVPAVPDNPDDPHDLGYLGAATGYALNSLLYLAEATPELACTLYVELPIVAIVRAEGVAEAALKRVRVLPPAAMLATHGLVSQYKTNKNPAVADVRANPADAAACEGGFSLTTPCLGPAHCGGEACASNGFCALPLEEVPLCAGDFCAPLMKTVTLCARETTDSSEGYSQCKGSATPVVPEPTEELQWQWYVTAGKIAGTDFNGNAVSEELELTPAAGDFKLWVIVRDGRGGTSWVERAVVAP